LSTFYSLSRIYGARYAKERSNTQSKLTVQTRIPVHRSSSKLMRQNTRHCLELHERIDCAQLARRIALPVVGPHTHHLGSGQSSHPTLLLAHHMASSTNSTKTACRAPSEPPPFSNVARHLFSKRVFGGGVSCSVEVVIFCVHKGHFLRGCHTPGERLRKFCVKNSERPATSPCTIFHLLGKKLTPRFLRSGGAAPLASHEPGRIKARGAGEVNIWAKKWPFGVEKQCPRPHLGCFRASTPSHGSRTRPQACSRPMPTPWIHCRGPARA
jgi:hypothetical protein